MAAPFMDGTSASDAATRSVRSLGRSGRETDIALTPSAALGDQPASSEASAGAVDADSGRSGQRGFTVGLSKMRAVTSGPLSWVPVGADALAIRLRFQGDSVGVVTEVVQEAGDGEVEVQSGTCRLRCGEIPEAGQHVCQEPGGLLGRARRRAFFLRPDACFGQHSGQLALAINRKRWLAGGKVDSLFGSVA